MLPKPKWVWSRAGFQTDRRPGERDIMESTHPDVMKLAPLLKANMFARGWYQQANALVEGDGEDAFVISFYDRGVCLPHSAGRWLLSSLLEPQCVGGES